MISAAQLGQSFMCQTCKVCHKDTKGLTKSAKCCLSIDYKFRTTLRVFVEERNSKFRGESDHKCKTICFYYKKNNTENFN